MTTWQRAFCGWEELQAKGERSCGLGVDIRKTKRGGYTEVVSKRGVLGKAGSLATKGKLVSEGN